MTKTEELMVAFPLMASLIAAARSEGVAEGRKEGITKGIARNAYEMGKHEGMAEGAEQLKNQIRFHGGHYTQRGDTIVSEYIWPPRTMAKAQIDLFIIPAHIIVPEAQP